MKLKLKSWFPRRLVHDGSGAGYYDVLRVAIETQWHAIGFRVADYRKSPACYGFAIMFWRWTWIWRLEEKT